MERFQAINQVVNQQLNKSCIDPHNNHVNVNYIRLYSLVDYTTSMSHAPGNPLTVNVNAPFIADNLLKHKAKCTLDLCMFSVYTGSSLLVSLLKN